MIKSLKKISHLIRYFILLGIGIFVAFLKNWHDEILVYLIGPPLYLAHFLRDAVKSAIPGIPYTTDVNYYWFLLPITVLYYGVFGTLLKILWNEHGIMRIPTFLAFILFSIFIHYFTGTNLTNYFAIYP